MDITECRAILAGCLSQLAVRSVEFLAEGWDNVVFEVNGELLFRFPKRQAVAESLSREIRLLAKLAPVLPVQIPQFTYVSTSCTTPPFLFAGYRRIPGVQLSQARPAPDCIATLAGDLGRFLCVLHSFPLDPAATIGVQPYAPGGAASVRAFLRSMHETVPRLLPTGERRRFFDWLERLPGMLNSDERVLAHNDLGDEHILLDPVTGSLTGIIDFGDAGFGDPALDFAGLITALGEESTRLALAAYGLPDDEVLLGRARAYAQLVPLHEVVFGLQTGDHERVDAGLAQLRAALVS